MSKQFDLVVKNGIVVTSGDTGKLDIAIKDGKIAHLAANISEDLAEKVIDAEGAYVMPGGVDAHVHLAQDFPSGPSGRLGKCADDFETGSRSAICGGTTTFISFAQQNRWEESLLQVVENYDARAKATGSYCDYAYHVIITRPELETLKVELPVIVGKWGITSCKLFMTYAALQLRDNELLDVMYEARRLAITTMIHAENGDLISWLTDKLEERGMVEPRYHAESRPPVVEMEATSRAIVLAEMIQNPVLFVHVGSASAAEVIRNAQTRGFPVFAETCPQYLHLTWEDLKKFHSPQCFENSKMICSPPPGPDDSDQEALWTGLRNGTFTIYSSDHCPFRYGDIDGKALGIVQHEESMQSVTCPVDQDHVHEVMHGKSGHFKYIPNGCPGIETRLPLLFNYGLLEGRITPERFVELTSTAPAKLYGLYPRKGALLPGLSDADLVIWYPENKMVPFSLTNDHLHHGADYSPYEGMMFNNWPRYTIIRGKIVWAERRLFGSPKDGEYLKRQASQLTMSAVKSIANDKRRVATWLYDNGK
ncbi:dihydropyrimidinase [Cryptococcus bacillisporus CA1280]|uniref:dihydropyrimidinase n=1 Tax=Cryptococcus bacillisporus CA1280 TaxID=1296109 RepID=UPI0033696AFE